MLLHTVILNVAKNLLPGTKFPSRPLEIGTRKLTLPILPHSPCFPLRDSDNIIRTGPGQPDRINRKDRDRRDPAFPYR